MLTAKIYNSKVCLISSLQLSKKVFTKSSLDLGWPKTREKNYILIANKNI